MRRTKRHFPEILGDGARAEGYAEFLEMVLKAEQMADEDGGLVIRLMRPMTVGLIEAMREESERGVDSADLASAVAHAMAWSLVAVQGCLFEPGTAMRVGRELADEFGHAFGTFCEMADAAYEKESGPKSA